MIQHGMQESPEDDVVAAGFPLAGLEGWESGLAESGRAEDGSGRGTASPGAQKGAEPTNYPKSQASLWAELRAEARLWGLGCPSRLTGAWAIAHQATLRAAISIVEDSASGIGLGLCERARKVMGLDGLQTREISPTRPDLPKEVAKPQRAAEGRRGGKARDFLQEALEELEDCCLEGDEPMLSLEEARALSGELARLRRAAGEPEWRPET